MKTTLITPPQEFQPVTIQLTFETEEELNAMIKLTQYSVSVPDFLVREKILHHDQPLQSILLSIFYLLKPVGNWPPCQSVDPSRGAGT